MATLAFYKAKLSALQGVITVNDETIWMPDNVKAANIAAVEREVTMLRASASEDGFPDIEGGL